MLSKNTGPSLDDKWGRNPSIRSMRRIFAGMEKTQTELLSTLGISPLDQRLRLWRQNALSLFEQQWGQETQRGCSLDERQIAGLYGACFTSIIGKAGIAVSPSLIPPDGEAQ